MSVHVISRPRIRHRLVMLLALVSLVSQPLIPTSVLADSRPTVNSVSGLREVNRGDYVEIKGQDLDLVRRVLVDGLATKYLLEGERLIRIKIPNSTQPGDATVTLSGDFESIALINFVTIAPVDFVTGSKVTVGSFNGFVAVYTKNLKGKRLSIQVGNTWRVVNALPSNFTKNVLKVGVGRTIGTKVLVERQLVKVHKLVVR